MQCGANVDTDGIVKVMRLGKKESEVREEGNSGRVRPLLVVMRDVESKGKVFRGLANLKRAPEKYRGLSIQHDQTKKQMEEDKKLLEEAREKEANEEGKWWYRVRGPPWAIIQFKPPN